VLAVAIDSFKAQAVAEVAADGVPAATSQSELVDATIRRFAAELAPAAGACSVRFTTTIPRLVGLGGSSAIVIAALRALCSMHGVRLEPAALASLALAIEVEDLGIAAGLQDRVAQSFGGLTFMEFSGAEPRYEQLERSLLPPLLIAWRARTAASSGIVHGDLRRRFSAGESVVVDAIGALAKAARGARDALAAGDRERLFGCVDATFDARAAMMTLDPRHVEMVSIARRCGAAANYTGSGGAIVCVCRDSRHRVAVGRALRDAGCGTVDA
jgi:glucuronokinase